MRTRWLYGLILVALSLLLAGCPEAPLPVGSRIDVQRASDADPDADPDGGAADAGDDQRLATAPALR